MVQELKPVQAPIGVKGFYRNFIGVQNPCILNRPSDPYVYVTLFFYLVCNLPSYLILLVPETCS
uniref:Uncharacterized protein n=1 Tax=Arundo donax TaxID=35708 RepID=A0A0A9AB67_ARUDO